MLVLGFVRSLHDLDFYISVNLFERVPIHDPHPARACQRDKAPVLEIGY
jgi:hypothetical protein